MFKVNIEVKGTKEPLLKLINHVCIGGRKIKESKKMDEWKEKQEAVCVGKEPKELLESTKEMEQGEKGETSQKQARNQ